MRKSLIVYNGISIIFVVLIHANAYYLHYINSNNTKFLMKLLVDIIYIAVPMFIFISGYKYELTKKNRNLNKYYKSKINNIIKPTLIISIVWIIIFLSLAIIKKVIVGQDIEIMFYMKILIYRIGQIMIGNNDIYQLWYIPMYVIITFSYPFIERYITGYKKILLFFSFSIFQVIGSNYFAILNTHPLDFIYYFWFFEMGILFYNKEKNITNMKIILLMIYIGALAVNLYIQNGIISEIIIKIIMYPIGIVLFYYISLYLKNSKILNSTGKYSFYIYVLHEPIILSNIGLIFQKLGVYKSWICVLIISCIGILVCIYLYKVSLIFKIGRFFWNNEETHLM